MVAWACGKLEYKDDEPMRSLTGRTWEILDELSGQKVILDELSGTMS